MGTHPIKERPTGETLLKRPTKETYKIDLQKRPTKETSQKKTKRNLLRKNSTYFTLTDERILNLPPAATRSHA